MGKKKTMIWLMFNLLVSNLLVYGGLCDFLHVKSEFLMSKVTRPLMSFEKIEQQV